MGKMGPAQSNWRNELRAMIALAVPVVLSELGWMPQGVVDTIMVGKLGPAAIGAVALGNAVYYTPSLFGIGLVLGLDTLVSQAYGRRDHDECHRWLAQGVYLACIASVPLMVLLVRSATGSRISASSPEVAGPAGSYLRILLLGHAAAAALRRGAALPAGRGPGARHHGHVCAGQPAELVRQLGVDLRQARHARAGRRRLGDFNVLRASAWRRALIGFAWRYERKRGHPLFRHWARPQPAIGCGNWCGIGAPAAGQILLEVGAWNLGTFSAGWLTPGALATHQIALNYAASPTWCRWESPRPQQ